MLRISCTSRVYSLGDRKQLLSHGIEQRSTYSSKYDATPGGEAGDSISWEVSAKRGIQPDGDVAVWFLLEPQQKIKVQMITDKIDQRKF